MELISGLWHSPLRFDPYGFGQHGVCGSPFRLTQIAPLRSATSHTPETLSEIASPPKEINKNQR